MHDSDEGELALLRADLVDLERTARRGRWAFRLSLLVVVAVVAVALGIGGFTWIAPAAVLPAVWVQRRRLDAMETAAARCRLAVEERVGAPRPDVRRLAGGG